MAIDLFLSPNQARQEVGTRLNTSISRTAFYVWRKKLNMLEDDLTLEHVEVLTLFGNFVRSGQTLSMAQLNTANQLRRQGL